MCQICGRGFRRNVRLGAGWRWKCPHCGIEQPGPAMLRAQMAESCRELEAARRKWERGRIRRRYGLARGDNG